MKKSTAGHKRPGERSARNKNNGEQIGGLTLEPVSQPVTPEGEACLTSEELTKIEALKAERDSLEEIPKVKNKKARKGSTNPPTNWTDYVGSLRDADGRVRFAVEVLGSNALTDVLLNGPPDPKYGVSFDILALMKESLACAKDAESHPTARAHALLLFDLLETLVRLTTDNWGYTIAAIAFMSGGMCNRLREGETMEAAKKGDVAHRGRKKAGEKRARPDVWKERLRLFKFGKKKAAALERRPNITEICRDIAADELRRKFERPVASKELEYRADTIERQLRQKFPKAFPTSRRNSPKESSKRT